MKRLFFKGTKTITCLVVVFTFFFFKEEFVPEIQRPNRDAKTDLPDKTNSAFKAGEVLNYRLHYGFVDAGVAIMKVMPEIKEISGRKIYHIVGIGYSKGTFDWFFKVRDKYETYL